MNIQDRIVLSILYDQGSLMGRARLQKLVFLTQMERISASPFEFRSREYGPFSADLVRCVDRLEATEYLDRYKDGVVYHYEVNPDTNCDFNHLEEAGKVSQYFGNLPISRLLEIVYNRYPKYTKNSII